MKKLLLVFLTSLLVACSSTSPTTPTPFKGGAKVEAPFGCDELRQQNPKADC
jgi:hypothetical protein